MFPDLYRKAMEEKPESKAVVPVADASKPQWLVLHRNFENLEVKMYGPFVSKEGAAKYAMVKARQLTVNVQFLFQTGENSVSDGRQEFVVHDLEPPV